MATTGRSRMVTSTAVVALALLASGCVTAYGEKRIADDRFFGQIKAGATTKAEVRARLGAPFSPPVSANGKEWCMYSYARNTTRPATFIPIVDPFVGGHDMQTYIVQVLRSSHDSRPLARSPRAPRTELRRETGLA